MPQQYEPYCGRNWFNASHPDPNIQSNPAGNLPEALFLKLKGGKLEIQSGIPRSRSYCNREEALADLEQAQQQQPELVEVPFRRLVTGDKFRVPGVEGEYTRAAGGNYGLLTHTDGTPIVIGFDHSHRVLTTPKTKTLAECSKGDKVRLKLDGDVFRVVQYGSSKYLLDSDCAIHSWPDNTPTYPEN